MKNIRVVLAILALTFVGVGCGNNTETTAGQTDTITEPQSQGASTEEIKGLQKQIDELQRQVDAGVDTPPTSVSDSETEPPILPPLLQVMAVRRPRMMVALSPIRLLGAPLRALILASLSNKTMAQSGLGDPILMVNLETGRQRTTSRGLWSMSPASLA